MEIQFLGGATEVGRLGMLLRQGPETLLFDYGMLPRDPPQYPMKAPPVERVFVSHAHLDHSGPVPCDTLVIESTYAGRNHPDRLKTQHEFLEKIRAVNNRGGIALIPAFAVGRTQDMLLTLAAGKFDVWLDGMGKKVNNIYMDHPEYLRSAKKLREAMNRVRVVRSQRGGLQALEADAI